MVKISVFIFYINSLFQQLRATMQPHLLPCHSSLLNLNIPNENLETKVAILLLRDVIMKISVKQ